MSKLSIGYKYMFSYMARLIFVYHTFNMSYMKTLNKWTDISLQYFHQMLMWRTEGKLRVSVHLKKKNHCISKKKSGFCDWFCEAAFSVTTEPLWFGLLWAEEKCNQGCHGRAAGDMHLIFHLILTCFVLGIHSIGVSYKDPFSLCPVIFRVNRVSEGQQDSQD